MAVTAAQVKELRDRTGAGMMDCKKALTATDGDIELAMKTCVKVALLKLLKKQVTSLLKVLSLLRKAKVSLHYLKLTVKLTS